MYQQLVDVVFNLLEKVLNGKYFNEGSTTTNAEATTNVSYKVGEGELFRTDKFLDGVAENLRFRLTIFYDFAEYTVRVCELACYA